MNRGDEGHRKPFANRPNGLKDSLQEESVESRPRKRRAISKSRSATRASRLPLCNLSSRLALCQFVVLRNSVFAESRRLLFSQAFRRQECPLHIPGTVEILHLTTPAHST